MFAAAVVVWAHRSTLRVARTCLVEVCTHLVDTSHLLLICTMHCMLNVGTLAYVYTRSLSRFPPPGLGLITRRGLLLLGFHLQVLLNSQMVYTYVRSRVFVNLSRAIEDIADNRTFELYCCRCTI